MVVCQNRLGDEDRVKSMYLERLSDGNIEKIEYIDQGQAATLVVRLVINWTTTSRVAARQLQRNQH